ncbi:hypothetical protein V2J09_001586 [Rumex salicifolius]
MSIQLSEPIISITQKFVRFNAEHSGVLFSGPEKTGKGQNGNSKWTAATQQGFLQRGILDPQSSFLQKWNKIFVIACVLSVAVDPLFFYIPIIDDERKCLDLDTELMIAVCVLRSLTDLFYMLHIILQFRTGFISPPSRVMGRGELNKDPLAIAKRYLSSYFWIDVLSVLPLPQLVVLLVVPNSSSSIPKATKHFLKIVIFSQYIPRLIRISPVYKEMMRTSGIIAETAWAGAAFNLFLYIIASHVVGSFWYMFAIDRENNCWRTECGKLIGCKLEHLYCKKSNMTTMQQFPACILKIPDDHNQTFNYGIFYPALFTVVRSRDFPQKLLYCFWWGLRNLSSLGQNLQTSPFFGENLFCVCICVGGLVLFALLIGNMQTYLQSTTVRVEEMRVRKRDAERWMSHRLLPENLRDRIRRFEQYKWQETRGVDEESLIRNLPKDLKRDVKRHLCLSLLMKVPMVKKMDEQLLDAMCHRLKPVLYTANSSIVREGDPVDEMLFIMRGRLKTMTTNGGRTGFFNLVHLEEGDFCGEELLTWALDPLSSSNLPISTRTVQTITEVEAFALLPDDFKFVASQFRKLHSKQMRHTFRFYSQQWKLWAASFIQSAWRQHCRRKQQEKAQREREEKLQDALVKGERSTLSFGATIYASRFAANILKSTRRNSDLSKPRPFKRLPSLVNLQKPAEPDFSSEYD